MTTELQRYNAFIEQAKQLLAEDPSREVGVRVYGGSGTASGEVEGCRRVYEIRQGQELLLQYQISGIRYDNWREKNDDESESLTSFRQSLGLEKKLEEE